MQTPIENPAPRSAPLRIFGIVQIAACLLYGGVAFLALFGLAMCNDSGNNDAFCGRAWLFWLAAAIAALVNFVVGLLMIFYKPAAAATTMPMRMRVYIVVSVIAWLIIAAFLYIAISGQ